MPVLQLVQDLSVEQAMVIIAQKIGINADEITVNDLEGDETYPFRILKIYYKGRFIFEFILGWWGTSEKIGIDNIQFKNLLFCFKGWLDEFI